MPETLTDSSRLDGASSSHNASQGTDATDHPFLARCGASPEAIAHHYDVGNRFYALWLDETLSYTCAHFSEDEALSLHQAQNAKLDLVLQMAGVDNLPQESLSDKRLLDIGCGWGGLLHHARKRGLGEAVGLTLSREQEVLITAAADPGVKVHYIDWRDFESERGFDIVTLIESIEAFVQPNMSREQRTRVYRHLFESCHNVTNVGATLVIQMITYGNAGPEHLDEFIAERIFPESDLPRLGEVFTAAERLFEPITMHNHRSDYVRTLRKWHSALKEHREEAKALVGPRKVADYETYLRLSMAMFEIGTCDLIRVSFRRVQKPWL
ncbi:class I SAM-dependent methyltransferase [Cognatiyoonia sp. IB215182]|uniref:class I SAM-dependent methyltransferase n=1 Tax=Cognatiyoonia sp. IB215182 TaxID=3097353 RepID=UPI002A0DC0B7|nr:class I SAM-dependent methyltransferase [Cognatiyoonia sp. IB215182]MDX8355333.1 class I SAM-dependent methyltransferase [Cognatiyoonia sp. IB215182]